MKSSNANKFWLPQGEYAPQLERQARAVWSSIAEATDPVARLLWLAMGAVDSLQAVYDGDLKKLTAEFENALAMEESAFISVVSARQPRGMPKSSDIVEKSLTSWRARITPDTHLIQEKSFDFGISCINPLDPQWPSKISDLGINTPLTLWVKGTKENIANAANTRAVAVVGSRAATSYGLEIAYNFSAALVERGVSVASGGAFGIDAAAHQGALAARSANVAPNFIPTVAFLAGGLDSYYPKANSQLLNTIASSAALYSEAPIGSTPSRWRFLARNRLMAAFADATLVVEAAWRSGALSTASHADALSRNLGAVPGNINSAASSGCHRLIKDFGAHLITDVDEILELLLKDSHENQQTLQQAASLISDLELLSARDRLVYDAIPPYSAIYVKDLAKDAGIDLESCENSLRRILALQVAQINGKNQVQRVIK